MSAHLHIDRLILTGIESGMPALALRDAIERALSELLSAEAIRRLKAAPVSPLPSIIVGKPQPGRTLAMHVALAIRAALLQPKET